MEGRGWCEHDEKTSKYTMLEYQFADKMVKLRVQSWFCPEYGMHGAETQVLNPPPTPKQMNGNPATYPLIWLE